MSIKIVIDKSYVTVAVCECGWRHLDSTKGALHAAARHLRESHAANQQAKEFTRQAAKMNR